MLTPTRRRAFTLIELLIVVAILGIIATIIIPNLLDAIQKSRQRRTVADMRNVGTAWMAWLTDQVGAASAGQTATLYDGSDLDPITHANVQNQLRPNNGFFYTQKVEEFDGWNNAFMFCRNDNLLAANCLAMCSPGRNGTMGENPDGTSECCDNWTIGSFVATDYDQDMMWADGYLVRYPGSLQQ
ncbi:MAG: type II secretion system protein [Acidobacteriota bacterium]